VDVRQPRRPLVGGRNLGRERAVDQGDEACPIVTMIQVQIARGSPVTSAKLKVVKMPVVIEMNEKATAKDSN
jgi:hypothetical protein